MWEEVVEEEAYIVRGGSGGGGIYCGRRLWRRKQMGILWEEVVEEEADGYIVGGGRKILEAGRYRILFVTELYYIICISVYIIVYNNTYHCILQYTTVYYSSVWWLCAGGGLGGGEWRGVLAHEELVGLLLGRNGLCQDHDA